MDVFILYTVLTLGSIPALLALRWYVRREPETHAAFNDLHDALGDLGAALVSATGAVWMVDRLEAARKRYDRLRSSSRR